MSSRLTMNKNLQPSIRKLNLTVADILRWLGSGMSQEQIMKDHPGLEPEDFLTVFNHATFILDMKHAAERMAAIREEFKAKIDGLDKRCVKPS